MDSGRARFSPADVEFMQGMIHHHAQAILMSAWAPTHDASPAIRELTARIIVAQRDEIAFMQRWLKDRGQAVPQPMELQPGMAGMPGMSDSELMPGMLTAAQMAALGSARGPEFDRLFLTGMIQHHRGAVSMVKELIDNYGAERDELVFKLASDVNVDQTTEIARMQKMLASLVLGVDVQ